jgi:hypothetical protein
LEGHVVARCVVVYRWLTACRADTIYRPRMWFIHNVAP